MKRIADQLPPEIAQQLHPARRKNEVDYWAVRDQLLDQYRGQWIGFADGTVIASGSSPVTVFHAAEASGRHPFFICVGREEEPCRIRRANFPYHASQRPTIGRFHAYSQSNCVQPFKPSASDSRQVDPA